MARKKPSFSTVVALMSDNAQARLESDTSPESDTIPLDKILPDFSQPRQLMPVELAKAVMQGQTEPAEALELWLQQTGSKQSGSAERHTVRELTRLADSIAQHGLINPISLRSPRPDEEVPEGIEYLIVTGERRYWAFIYLVNNNIQIHEGNSIIEPTRIKATITAEGVSVKAHQLIENLLREDINAVEKALGMWALRYELSGVNYSSLGDETPGKVNDSSLKLVTWAEVEKTLDISKRYRIFVTSVLRLCPEAQQIVMKHNLAEMTIRPIVQKLKNHPDLQVKALEQLVTWQEENEADDGPNRAIVASVKSLVEQLLADEAGATEADSPGPEPARTRSVSSEPVIRFRDKVRQALDFLNRLKKRDRSHLNKALEREEYADIRVDLRNLRQQIDEILAAADRAEPAGEADQENH